MKGLVKEVNYKVENETYKLNSNDIITGATYQNGKYSDTHAVNSQIAKIKITGNVGQVV